MLHHIFRNLWNSRKRNVWILLELIVIAIVCWMVIDPLFVIFAPAPSDIQRRDTNRAGRRIPPSY